MEMEFARYKPALERQLQSWFWLNNYMRPWILSLDKLVEVQGSDIVINLTAFNELYTDRYFNGQVGEVCKKLVDNLLKPRLGLFLREIGYKSHHFEIVIRGRGAMYKQVVNVKNPDWE